MPIFIGMAAQPRRFPNLKKALPVLAKQCDKVWLTVNPERTKIEDSPTSKLPEEFNHIDNLELIINARNEGDREKFIGMQYQKSGYYLTVDDDILYPKDYVEKHLEYMMRIQNWGITCVHGSTFNPKHIQGFTGRRRMYHFEWGWTELTKVLMPGTGTTCFEVSKFKMLPKEMPVTNMADVWVACKAAQRGVPTYTIPRPGGWLKGLRSYGEAIAENRPVKEMEATAERNKAHLIKMFKRL